MRTEISLFIHSDINHDKGRHSCEGRNPGKQWIPGQARNDKLDKIYVVMYIIPLFHFCKLLTL